MSLLAGEVASSAAFSAPGAQPGACRSTCGGTAVAGQCWPCRIRAGIPSSAVRRHALAAPLSCGRRQPAGADAADEPFSALDALTRSDMRRWLLDIWEQNRRSVLFITHNIEEAPPLADRVYVLSNRPAAVPHEVQVPFDRPRQETITEEPAFLERKRQIAQWMKEEQQKARLL